MSDLWADDLITSLRLAAEKLAGFQCRQFQAEMATKYCGGSARRAEATFGWSRESVNIGLNELRTGIRCLECFSQRGRKKTGDNVSEIPSEIQKIVDPQSGLSSLVSTALRLRVDDRQRRLG